MGILFGRWSTARNRFPTNLLRMGPVCQLSRTVARVTPRNRFRPLRPTPARSIEPGHRCPGSIDLARRCGRCGAGSGLGVLVHPVEGLRDGLLPVPVQPLALVLLHLRGPAAVLGPVVDHVLLTGPEPDRDPGGVGGAQRGGLGDLDRKSTRLNSSHVSSSYAVFCPPPSHRAPLSLHDALPISQSKVFVTAFFQFRYSRSRSFSSICGVQRRSSAQLSITSCSPDQNPTAIPAA